MPLPIEIQQLRAKRKTQAHNERAMQNSLDYRDGYAAAFADYTSFREPIDGLEELVALNEKHIAGYRAGYAAARRGAPNRWPHHPAPQRFGHAA